MWAIVEQVTIGRLTALPFICDVVRNNGQKSIAITRRPGVEWKTNLSLQSLWDEKT